MVVDETIVGGVDRVGEAMRGFGILVHQIWNSDWLYNRENMIVIKKYYIKVKMIII